MEQETPTNTENKYIKIYYPIILHIFFLHYKIKMLSSIQTRQFNKRSANESYVNYNLN